jgi:hypothetical protein
MNPPREPPAHALAMPQASAAAALLVDAFADYNARFADITRRAQRRFERRDWQGSALDARQRIDLYDICIRETQGRLDGLLDDRVRSRPLWASMRQAFELQIAALTDREFYKTWFNSLSRRHFHTRGIASRIPKAAMPRRIATMTSRVISPLLAHVSCRTPASSTPIYPRARPRWRTRSARACAPLGCLRSR